VLQFAGVSEGDPLCAAQQSIRFPPQDFHTCGKHCGKAGETVEAPLERLDIPGLQAWRKPVNGDFSGFAGCRAWFAPAWSVSARRKSVFS
jgi:hypothetical protein